MKRMKERLTATGLLLAAMTSFAFSGDNSSEYTRLDRESDCTVIAASSGEGDWAHYVCPGYGGYPFVIRYGDLRETITYGFATEGGMPNILPFNEAGPTIEWRMHEADGGRYPFAAIQRWFVSHPEGMDAIEEMLVVSRVGQPDGGGACAVAFIPASGNPQANEQARKIADQRAQSFECASDRVEVDPDLTGIVAVR